MNPTQVFLCYARDDETPVVGVYDTLRSAGFKPWMDKKDLVPGDVWDESIRNAIRASKYFLVIITRNSVDRRGYLQREIKEALDVQAQLLESDRYIVPVRLEKCDIPGRLGHLQCADLFEQDGWLQLVAALGGSSNSVSGEEANPVIHVQRGVQLPIGGIALPCFFPSVSGAAKNALTPLEHLKIVLGLKHPLFLVSAYDIAKALREERIEINSLLNQATTQGQVVLMDSGLYEKRWLRDRRWLKKDFHDGLRNAACHMAFCYDNPSATGSVKELVDGVVKSVKAARRATGFGALVPIVHARKPDLLPEVCRQVAEELGPVMIAVAERELGEGLMAAASSLLEIRKALDSAGRHQTLHILGTGNPLSMLVYSLCGADSFDGLDWCQTVVDHTTGRLYHSQQLDFFAGQTPYGADSRLSYLTRLFAHNLQFYERWVTLVRMAVSGGKAAEICDRYLPAPFVLSLQRLLPGIGSGTVSRV